MGATFAWEAADLFTHTYSGAKNPLQGQLSSGTKGHSRVKRRHGEEQMMTQQS
jgi:hypothetical protein